MRSVLFVALLLPVLSFAQAKKSAPKSSEKTGNALQLAMERGKTVYNLACLTCHQADGSGVPSLNPPLTGTSWVLGQKRVLIDQVLRGSQGKVEIDGETFHNNMPPMAHLTDQQIADVLSYVRNSFGNKASLVTPAEVKVERAKKK